MTNQSEFIQSSLRGYVLDLVKKEYVTIETNYAVSKDVAKQLWKPYKRAIKSGLMFCLLKGHLLQKVRNPDLLVFKIDVLSKLIPDELHHLKIPGRNHSTDSLMLPPVTIEETLAYSQIMMWHPFLNKDYRKFAVSQLIIDALIAPPTQRKSTFVTQAVAFKERAYDDELVTKIRCRLCGKSFNSSKAQDAHLTDSQHNFRLAFHIARNNIKKTGGVTVCIKDFKMLDNIPLTKDVTKIFTLQVVNSTAKTFELFDITTLKAVAGVNFEQNLPLKLYPKSILGLQMIVMCKTFRDIYYPLLLWLKDVTSLEETTLPVELIYRVINDDLRDIIPTEPYTPPSKAVYHDIVDEIIPGLLTDTSATRFKPVNPLPYYKLPRDVIYLLNTGLKASSTLSESQSGKLKEIRSLMNVKDKSKALNATNYDKMLQLLLFFEEHQLCKDIHDFDRDDQVMLKLNSSLLKLNVPGLAEKRPSLLRGDSVYVKESRDSVKKYQGIVHRVEMEDVVLGFDKSFVNKVFMENKKFHVSFDFNRLPLRAEHQAASLSHLTRIKPYLFPSGTNKSPLTCSLRWTDKRVANNVEQQQAVQRILEKTAFPAPYLIFGPPGTGKTMTVTEAIHQIHRTTVSNVLVCAPSNAAANEIAKRLEKTIPKSELFRYLSEGFPYKEIPPVIHKFINYNGQDFYHPSVETLQSFRIVITTLVTASRLINGGVKRNHFDYIFIDEAGHATETETLIPIAGILSSVQQPGVLTGQIVLAGDPEQLGPIIHSKIAQEYGFGTSMLERLMNGCPLYGRDAKGKYNSSAVTKLIKNYRSHKSILEFPSKQFYHGELKPSGDTSITNLALGWEGLPNPKFPVIFHSVVSAEQREKHSPSFFNLQEANIVLSYVDNLMGAKLSGVRVEEKHIGIISPYKKQVEKLNILCKKRKFDQLTIGSVEQLQGQERLIIIICTVRSKPEFISHDMKHHLGFLNNRKRLNVALTRAQALLIIIGNPHLLQYDPCWRELIKYIKGNGGFKGKPFDFDENLRNLDSFENPVGDLAAKVDAMNLEGPGACGDGLDFPRLTE